MDHKTDTDSERAAFEAACKTLFACSEATFSRDQGAYYNTVTRTFYGRPINDYASVSMLWSIFQAGRASLAVSAGSEPAKRVFLVATGEEHEGEATYTRYDDAPPPLCDSECLYTHPSPPEGAGWISVKDQLPPCRDDQDYIGINSAGFAGVFNAIADIAGNVYCMMETAEESVSIMSDLSIWKPFIRPLTAPPASEAKERGNG